ncbi:MAG TPA: potassium transporter Trk [Ilumatobacteraceae bacterium]
MADVVLILTVLAFFVVCAAYVSWCDHIIGPDPEPATERELAAPEPIPHAEVPA